MENQRKSYDYNMVGFAGRLTRDPEPLAYTPDGKAYTRVSIANNQGEITNFISVTFWGESAKVVSKYMKSGRYVIIEGKLFSTRNDKIVQGKVFTLLTVGNARIYFVPDGRGNSQEPDNLENQQVDIDMSNEQNDFQNTNNSNQNTSNRTDGFEIVDNDDFEPPF